MICHVIGKPLKTLDELKSHVHAEIWKYEGTVKAEKGHDLTKTFTVAQVRSLSATLIQLSQDIRDFYDARPKKTWYEYRPAESLASDGLLPIGQAITSALFYMGLRDQISDPISYWFGISYSALQVHTKYTHKTDKHRVYLLHKLDSTANADRRVGVAKDGCWTPMPKEEFLQNYDAE